MVFFAKPQNLRLDFKVGLSAVLIFFISQFSCRNFSFSAELLEAWSRSLAFELICQLSCFCCFSGIHVFVGAHGC